MEKEEELNMYCANCMWSVWLDGADWGYCGKKENSSMAITVVDTPEDNKCSFYDEKSKYWFALEMIEVINSNMV